MDAPALYPNNMHDRMVSEGKEHLWGGAKVRCIPKIWGVTHEQIWKKRVNPNMGKCRKPKDAYHSETPGACLQPPAPVTNVKRREK